MWSSKVQEASAIQLTQEVEGSHLLLYDGVCGLCHKLTQFVLEHDRQRLFRFASLQSAAARKILEPFGCDPDHLTSMRVLVSYRSRAPRLLSRGRAALFVMTQLGWPWRAAGMLTLLPTIVLDLTYDVIARNRYRVFGRHERCLLPRPDFRSRFIESEVEALPKRGD